MTRDIEWSVEGLSRLGFTGWTQFRELQRADLPRDPGVYVVARTTSEPPTFLDRSVGGPHKGEDLTVPITRLSEAWTDAAEILYIGKATSLRTRLWAYLRQGRGHSASHYGGRFLWQLPQSNELLVGWHVVNTTTPAFLEEALIAQYVADYGKRPFANLVGGQALSRLVAQELIAVEFGPGR